MSQIKIGQQDVTTKTISSVVYVSISGFNPMFKCNPKLEQVVASCIETNFVKTEEAVVGLGAEFTSRVSTPEVVRKFYKVLAPYSAEADRQALELYQRRGSELGINLINISEWSVRYMVVKFLQDHHNRIVETTFKLCEDELDSIIVHVSDCKQFMLRFTDLLEIGIKYTDYPE
jgi:hypothetical protein